MIMAVTEKLRSLSSSLYITMQKRCSKRRSQLLSKISDLLPLLLSMIAQMMGVALLLLIFFGSTGRDLQLHE